MNARTSPFSPAAKIWLALRIWRLFILLQLRKANEPLPEFVAQLGQPIRHHSERYSPVRLVRAINRALRVGRWQPTCLDKSLVLFRLLREQGDPAEVVVGLPPNAPDHNAHAWVEVNGVDVGPPPGRGNHVPLARFS